MQTFTCRRCQAEYANIRRLWRHERKLCPARNLPTTGLMLPDRLARRHVREYGSLRQRMV